MWRRPNAIRGAGPTWSEEPRHALMTVTSSPVAGGTTKGIVADDTALASEPVAGWLRG
jgi:hypothetical protein